MKPLSTAALRLLSDARRRVAEGSPSLQDALARAALAACPLVRMHPADCMRAALAPAVLNEPQPVSNLREAVEGLLEAQGKPTSLSTVAEASVSAFAAQLSRGEALGWPWDGTVGGGVISATRRGAVVLITSVIDHRPPKVEVKPQYAPEKPVFTPAPHELPGYVPEEEDDAYNARWEVP